MSTLTIDLHAHPLNSEPRNGDKVTFLVEGIVRRVEDELVDTSDLSRRSYMLRNREIEVVVTRLRIPPDR